MRPYSTYKTFSHVVFFMTSLIFLLLFLLSSIVMFDTNIKEFKMRDDKKTTKRFVYISEFGLKSTGIFSLFILAIYHNLVPKLVNIYRSKCAEADTHFNLFAILFEYYEYISLDVKTFVDRIS